MVARIKHDTKSLAQICPKSNAIENKPPSDSNHWKQAKLPWQRVRLDSARPIDGHMFLLAIGTDLSGLKCSQ